MGHLSRDQSPTPAERFGTANSEADVERGRLLNNRDSYDDADHSDADADDDDADDDDDDDDGYHQPAIETHDQGHRRWSALVIVVSGIILFAVLGLWVRNGFAFK